MACERKIKGLLKQLDQDSEVGPLVDSNGDPCDCETLRREIAHYTSEAKHCHAEMMKRQKAGKEQKELFKRDYEQLLTEARAVSHTIRVVGDEPPEKPPVKPKKVVGTAAQRSSRSKTKAPLKSSLSAAMALPADTNRVDYLGILSNKTGGGTLRRGGRDSQPGFNGNPDPTAAFGGTAMPLANPKKAPEPSVKKGKQDPSPPTDDPDDPGDWDEDDWGEGYYEEGEEEEWYVTKKRKKSCRIAMQRRVKMALIPPTMEENLLAPLLALHASLGDANGKVLTSASSWRTKGRLSRRKP